MKRTHFILLSVALDAVLVNLGFIIAFLIRFSGVLPAYNFNAFLHIAPFVTIAFIAAAWVNRLYEPESLDDVLVIVLRTVFSVTIGAVLTATIAFFGGSATVSFARLTLLIAWPILMFLFAAWRYLFLRFGSIRWPKQRVLILGGGHVAEDLIRELATRGHWGWSCVGVLVDDELAKCSKELDCLKVGTIDQVSEKIEETDANRLIVVSPARIRELVEALVLDEGLDVRIDVVPELYEVLLGNFDSQIGDVPLVHIAGARASEYFGLVKRLSDIVLALVGLVISAPILAVASLAIIVDDGTPILYRQERVGRFGKTFMVFKLRTMRRDAEKISGPVLATDEDPRVTRIGRHLRAFRIDEIPQLLNILSGDMSFIGPRPERPFFVEQHLREIPGYAERFKVRPGVTGLAQIGGGYATTAERKLKYDLIYVYHRTIAMEIRILAETVNVVLTRKGAR